MSKHHRKVDIIKFIVNLNKQGLIFESKNNIININLGQSNNLWFHFPKSIDLVYINHFKLFIV